MKYTIEPIEPFRYLDNGKIIILNGYAFMDIYGHCIIIAYGEGRRDYLIEHFKSDTNELGIKYKYINMKTAKMKITSIKDSDGWVELIYKLKFEDFKIDNPNLSEDELHDKFYTDVILKKIKHGEFADIEIEVDSNFKIVGGSIL